MNKRNQNNLKRQGKMTELQKRFRNGIYGVAVGDALGTPVQFCSREEVRRYPITGMKNDGTYRLPGGTWSDDTSMSLALAESLGRLKDINYEDVMSNFVKWNNCGKFTPDGKAFDQGYTCLAAIENWTNRKETGWPEKAVDCGLTEFEDNGNGSLMRILPISFYIYAKYGKDASAHGDIVRNVSKLTHAHPISQFACEFYCNMIYQMLENPELSKKEIFENVKKTLLKVWGNPSLSGEKEELKDVYERLYDQNFPSFPDEEIKSSGYVVHSLEAAIWCFLNTDNYRDCTLKAVNLGEDTDTIAAIAGGLASIYYEEIPQDWLDELRGKDVIENSIADMLALL